MVSAALQSGQSHQVLIVGGIVCIRPLLWCSSQWKNIIIINNNSKMNEEIVRVILVVRHECRHI